MKLTKNLFRIYCKRDVNKTFANIKSSNATFFQFYEYHSVSGKQYELELSENIFKEK